MDWLALFKDLGYPALITIYLLYTMTIKLEGIRDTMVSKLDEVKKELTDLRVQLAKGGSREG